MEDPRAYSFNRRSGREGVTSEPVGVEDSLKTGFLRKSSLTQAGKNDSSRLLRTASVVARPAGTHPLIGRPGEPGTSIKQNGHILLSSPERGPPKNQKRKGTSPRAPFFLQDFRIICRIGEKTVPTRAGIPQSLAVPPWCTVFGAVKETKSVYARPFFGHLGARGGGWRLRGTQDFRWLTKSHLLGGLFFQREKSVKRAEAYENTITFLSSCTLPRCLCKMGTKMAKCKKSGHPEGLHP